MLMLKLAWGYIKQNKKWAIATLLSAIIWVALLTAIATFGTSFNKMTRKTLRYFDGDHHFISLNLNKKQIEQLKEIEGVEEITEIPVVSYAKVKGIEITNQEKPYLKLMGVSPNDYEKLGYVMTSGKPAENPGEVILANSILYNTNQEIELGDLITIQKGKRIVDGKPIVDTSIRKSGLNKNFEQEEFYDSDILEKFEVTDIKEYRVVGFFSDTISMMELEDAGFESLVNEYSVNDGQNSVQIKLNEVSARSINKIKEFANYEKIKLFSKDILQTYFTGFDNFTSTIFGQTIVSTFAIGLVVIVAALLVIYQSFSMMTTQLSIQLGILASIGATRKQRQTMILYIALIIILCAIPIGIIIGYLGSYILLSNYQDVLYSYSAPSSIQIVVSPLALFLTSIGIILSTLLVTGGTAYKTNKLNAVEAIRQNKTSNKNIGAYPLPKWIKKIEHQLAIRNFIRNKQHYIAVILSLVASVVLIVSIASTINLVQPFVDTANRDVSYSLNDHKIDLKQAKSIITNLKKNENIAWAGQWNEYLMDIVAFSDQITPSYQEVLQKLQVNEIFFQIWVLDDETMHDFFSKKVEGDVLKQSILVDKIAIKHYFEADELTFKDNIFSIENGDKLKFKVMNMVASEGEILVDNITDSSGFGLVFGQPTLIVSQSYVNNSNNKFLKEVYLNQDDQFISNKMIFANGPKNSEVEKTVIDELKKSGLYNPVNLLNEYESGLLYYRSQQFIGITIYSFVVLVITIGLINIFNTISTNIKVRQREFSILRSNGMSPNSLNQMIITEAFIYGSITVLLSIPLSYIFSNILKKYISFGIQTSHFSFGITVGIAIFTLVVVLFISFMYSYRTLKDEPIVQSIML